MEWSISLQPQEELAAFARFGNAVASLCVEKKGARACLKKSFPQSASPTLRYILPSFGCRSPLRRPYSDKISHELGLAVHEMITGAGLNTTQDEVHFLPFWENGRRFFTIEGPNKEKVEIQPDL